MSSSCLIQYADMQIAAPKADVLKALESLRSDDNKSAVMNSVNDSLSAVVARINNDTASEKEMQNFCMDVAIWYANEILEGRAALNVSSH